MSGLRLPTDLLSDDRSLNGLRNDIGDDLAAGATLAALPDTRLHPVDLGRKHWIPGSKRLLSGSNEPVEARKEIVNHQPALRVRD